MALGVFTEAIVHFVWLFCASKFAEIWRHDVGTATNDQCCSPWLKVVGPVVENRDAGSHDQSLCVFPETRTREAGAAKS